MTHGRGRKRAMPIADARDNNRKLKCDIREFKFRFKIEIFAGRFARSRSFQHCVHYLKHEPCHLSPGSTVGLFFCGRTDTGPRNMAAAKAQDLPVICVINDKLSREVFVRVLSNLPLSELIRSAAFVSKSWRDAVLDGALWRSHLCITLPPGLVHKRLNQEGRVDIWQWPRLYGRLHAENLLHEADWGISPVASRACGSRRWLSGLYHNIPGRIYDTNALAPN